MASRASSEAPAPGFSVPIPALPKLGRTWYRRGALYWLCRARTTVFLVLVMAMFCFFALSLYAGVRDLLPSTARVVWDGVQVAASVVTLVWGWVTQRRGHREALLDPPTPEQTRQAKRDHDRRVPGRIALGRGLVVLAAPVMPAFAAYIVGWLAAWTTVREYPSEVGARRWLQEHTSGT
ncbi:hypothetical protein [Streptomyces camelliae]|uniref:Uncharacterized protein n=1 Tax=Streptomyces camelliae TaxID=3004093 RepID=A0ABY7NX77_9ACTN|nr:hypothetical protein [Streptomyces sp. HUAS 2-6]WBO62821.1 hypothetical protein O1G22_08320 [Streptomyces sp. HUAS 2-6]